MMRFLQHLICLSTQIFNYLIECVTFHKTETRTFGNRKKTRFLIANCWWLNNGSLKIQKFTVNLKKCELNDLFKILTGCWSACGLTEFFRPEKICRFATASVNIAFTFICSGIKSPRWNKSHASTTCALSVVRWQAANVTHGLYSICAFKKSACVNFRRQIIWATNYTFNRSGKSYCCSYSNLAGLSAIFHGDEIICISFTSGVGKRLTFASYRIKVKTGNVCTAITGSQR